MPSSISGSDTLILSGTSAAVDAPQVAAQSPGLDRFTVLLLATAVVALAVCEGIAIAGFDRSSAVQRRETAQRVALERVRDSDNSPPHIAVLGNSLMLDGADIPTLDRVLQGQASPAPYFVLATNYYDWFFGLKRLFAEGVRPRYILLGLSPNQLASPAIRGDYSARYLFQASDLPAVIRVTHMDSTAASDFVLAHYSEYYSTREIMRGFVLSRVLPSIGELLHNRLGNFRDPNLDDAQLRQVASKRLAALSQLCRENSSQFLLVVPPTYQRGAVTIAQVGREQGTPVLVPVADGEFDASYYQSDGLHLNEKGAQEFTTRLAESLLAELRR